MLLLCVCEIETTMTCILIFGTKVHCILVLCPAPFELCGTLGFFPGLIRILFGSLFSDLCVTQSVKSWSHTAPYSLDVADPMQTPFGVFAYVWALSNIVISMKGDFDEDSF